MKLMQPSYLRLRVALPALLALVALLVTLVPAATATTTTQTTTTAFVSGPDWTTLDSLGVIGDAQNVCAAATAPNPCPAGATNFGSPFSGAWSADLSSIPGATWIWAPGVTGSTSPAENAFYRFEKIVVVVPPNATNLVGTVKLAADDYAEVWINNRQPT